MWHVAAHSHIFKTDPCKVDLLKQLNRLEIFMMTFYIFLWFSVRCNTLRPNPTFLKFISLKSIY